MYYNEFHANRIKEKATDYIYVGTYEKGDKILNGKIFGIDAYKNNKTSLIRIKCDYCGEYTDMGLTYIKRGYGCTKCCRKYENSLAYHIQVELGEPLNKYWDWEKNTINPYLISMGSNKYNIWIKCTKTDYHGSYKIRCCDFKYKSIRCPYCHRKRIHPKDSFAQYHIDNTDPNFLEKYWSDKNTLNPWEIGAYSHHKVWILCQDKDYHNDNGGYELKCDDFTSGNRCGYCASSKIHELDSFGYKFPQYTHNWSNKNKKSPYEVAIYSDTKYIFQCDDCNKEIKMTTHSLSQNNPDQILCKKCTLKHSSKLEIKTKEILDKYKINYKPQKKFNGLVGVGNRRLSYDFYLPDYNILLECQGIQHEREVDFFGEHTRFEIQQEHDKRKFEYAINNNYIPMEIWYWDIDNIEEILIRELELK